MPYCTLSDITARTPAENIIQLTDDDGNGVVDEAKVDQAIADGDVIIEGKLRGRYPLPLDPVPGLITKVSADFAIYNIYARKMDVEMPKAVADRYSNGMKLLDQIQTGAITLGIADAETPATSSEGSYRGNKKAEDRVFPQSELDKW